MTDAPMPPEWFATIDLAKRDTPGPHDTPELLQARLAEERRRALNNALTVLPDLTAELENALARKVAQ